MRISSEKQFLYFCVTFLLSEKLVFQNVFYFNTKVIIMIMGWETFLFLYLRIYILNICLDRYACLKYLHPTTHLFIGNNEGCGLQFYYEADIAFAQTLLNARNFMYFIVKLNLKYKSNQM